MEARLISELLVQHLDRQPENVKLRIKVYMALRGAILEGRLPPGTKLPPTRTLAEDMDVGRNTIVRVYEQLTVEGYIEGRVGDGSYVSDAVARGPKAEAPKRLLGARREGLSRRGGAIAAHAGSSIAQRGAFSAVLLTLAQQPAHSLVSVQRLAERLGAETATLPSQGRDRMDLTHYNIRHSGKGRLTAREMVAALPEINANVAYQSNAVGGVVLGSHARSLENDARA